MSFNSITKKQRTPFQKLRIRNRKHRKQWKTRNRCSMQKVFIKLSGNSSRNIYARISILIKLQGSLLFVSSWKQVSISLMASFQTSEAFTVQGPKYTHTHANTRNFAARERFYLFMSCDIFLCISIDQSLFLNFFSTYWSIFFLISISQLNEGSICPFICPSLHLSINQSICVNATLCVYLISEISKKRRYNFAVLCKACNIA